VNVSGSDPRRADEPRPDDLIAADRRDRLRHTNQQPWGAFLTGLAINTVVVVILVILGFIVFSRVFT
jgi:hypothetical protein